MAASDVAVLASEGASKPLVLAAQLGQPISLQIRTGNLTAADGSRLFVGANISVHPPAIEFTSADYDALSKSSFRAWIQPPSDPLFKNDRWKHSQNVLSQNAWILEHEEFSSWKVSSTNLWIAGRPGCGKSVIATQIIDYLESTKAFIGYGFSSKLDEDRMYADSFLRAIIWQIVSLPDLTLAQKQGIARVYQEQPELVSPPQKNSVSTSASLPQLIDVLTTVLALFENPMVILDGLDECPNHEDFLKLLARQEFCIARGVRWIFISQKLQAIENVLKDLPEIDLDCDTCRESTDESITTWIYERLNQEKSPVIVDNAKKICDSVVNNCDSMFLWAVAATEELLWKLKMADDSKSIDDSIRSLEQLPSGLDSLLGYLVARITKSDPKLNKKQNETRNAALRVVLRWAFHSVRPLSINELQDIIASDVDVSAVVQLSMGRHFSTASIEEWIKLAYPLVLLKDDRIQLMHATFRDIAHHGESQALSDLQLVQVPSQMAKQCLQYLLQPTFSFYSCVPQDDRVLPDHPLHDRHFFDYACGNWVGHLSRLELISDELEADVISFLEDDNALTWLDAWIPYDTDLIQTQAYVNLLITSLKNPDWCVDMLPKILDEYKAIDAGSKKCLLLITTLAQACKVRGQFLEAEDYYKDLLTHYGPICEGCDSECVRLTLRLASVYLDKGDPDKCEELLQQVDDHIKNLNLDEGALEVIALKHCRIELNRVRGNFLALFESARDIHDLAGNTVVSEMLGQLALDSMAYALNHLGRYEEAKTWAIGSVKAGMLENSFAEQQAVVSWLLTSEIGLYPDSRVLAQLSRGVNYAFSVVSNAEFWLGNIEKSLEIRRFVWEYCHGALGDSYLETIWASCGLGESLAEVGLIQESDKILKQALESSQSVLGTEVRSTQFLMDLIASNCAISGQYEKALAMHKSVQETRIRTLGPEHEDTLASGVKIGQVLLGLKRWTDALDILVPTLDIALRRLGRMNVISRMALERIATGCMHLRRLALSEQIFRSLTNQTSYGEWSQIHIGYQIGLASCLRVRGCLSQSLRLCRKFSSLLRKKSREKTGLGIRFSFELAANLRIYGLYDEARSVLNRTLKLAMDAQGCDSVDAWRGQEQLALNFYDRGELEKAYTMMENVYKQAIKMFGEESDDTVETGVQMGVVLVELDDPEKLNRALELIDAAKNRIEHGRDPDTTDWYRESKARLLFKQEHYEQALEMHLGLLFQRRTTFGDSYYRTLDGYLDTGRSASKLGYAKQAKIMLETARIGYVELFGKVYPKKQILEAVQLPECDTLSSGIQRVLDQTHSKKSEAEEALEEAIATFGGNSSLILKFQLDATSPEDPSNRELALKLALQNLEDDLTSYSKSHSRCLEALGKIAEFETLKPFDAPLLENCILWAIEGNDPDVLKKVVLAGAHRMCRDQGYTPLGLAVKANKPELVKVLIDCEFDVNHVEMTGQSFMDIAVLYAGDIVHLLLAAHANLENIDAVGRTALQTACVLGEVAVVAELLAAGACLESPGTSSQAIHWAVRGLNDDIVDMLLDAGSDIEMRAEGLTPMHFAIASGTLDIVRLLISRGAKIDSTLDDGSTCLLFACWQGELEIVKFLLEKGARLDDKNEAGWGLVQCAVANDQLEVVKFLVTQGLDLSPVYAEKMTVLDVAANAGFPDLTAWLLEQGLDVHGGRLTPLHFAAADNGFVYEKPATDFHKLETVVLLLSAGADPNAQTEAGATPLTEALICGLDDIANVLVDHGAVLPVTKAMQFFIRAIMLKQVEIVRCVLRLCPANVSIPGMTLLHFATYMENIEIVSLLLDNGADIDATASDGSTSLHTAAQLRNADIVRLLLSRGAKIVVDNFGRRPIDWTEGDPDCVEAFGEPWNPRPVVVSRKAVLDYVRRLKQDPSANWAVLSRYLLALEQENDGQIAMEQMIKNGRLPSHCFLCQKVGDELKGTAHVCKSCGGLYVCDSCFQKHDGKPTSKVCSHLNFCIVPRPKWKDLDGVVDDGLTLMQWLDRLEREFTD